MLKDKEYKHNCFFYLLRFLDTQLHMPVFRELPIFLLQTRNTKHKCNGM